MAQTVADLFGANATLSSGVITIQLSDFSSIDDPNVATPSQAMAAILKHIKDTTSEASTDKTAGIAASEFQNDIALVNREDEYQVQESITINLFYATDISNNLDPDDVV